MSSRRHGRSAEQGYEVGPRACGNRTGRFARHGRSARPRDGHDADRQMPSGLGAAQESLPVGLRLGKIRTGQAQNLVGFAQLAIFAFQGFDAFTLFTGRPRTLAGVGLLATNPAMQGLRCTANLRGNGSMAAHSGGSRSGAQNHAHGTFTDFRGVGRSLSHGLSSSQELRPPRNPGRFSIYETRGDSMLRT